jgi:hypothetical protein
MQRRGAGAECKPAGESDDPPIASKRVTPGETTASEGRGKTEAPLILYRARLLAVAGDYCRQVSQGPPFFWNGAGSEVPTLDQDIPGRVYL